MFFNALNEFLQNGKYKMHKQGRENNLYRFVTDEIECPSMLELFYKREDFAKDWQGAIRSISFSEKFSLSAIMLDQKYHQFAVDNTEIINKVPVHSKEGLLVLKSRTCYNLFLERRQMT